MAVLWPAELTRRVRFATAMSYWIWRGLARYRRENRTVMLIHSNNAIVVQIKLPLDNIKAYCANDIFHLSNSFIPSFQFARYFSLVLATVYLYIFALRHEHFNRFRKYWHIQVLTQTIRWLNALLVWNLICYGQNYLVNPSYTETYSISMI